MAKYKVLNSNELARRYGGDSFAAIELKKDFDSSLFIPCRSLAINYAMGGGVPYGKLVEIFGMESNGKTILALDFAYGAQQLGGIVLAHDAENAVTTKWLEKNDLDLEKFFIYNKADLEGGSDWFRDMAYYWRSRLTNNEPILWIIDSIAQLVPAAIEDSDFKGGKAEMGSRAKMVGKLWRERLPLCKKLGVGVIAINQIRKKLGVGMFEDDKTTPGGEATRFAATIRLELVRGKQIKGLIKNGEFEENQNKGKKVGQNIYLRTAKNKIFPPQDSLKTQVYFSDIKTGYVGFNRYMGIPEILLEEKIITKRGSRFILEDDVIANGEDKILDTLHYKKKLRSKLVNASSINTISKTAEKLEEYNKNLFPIKNKSTEDEEEDSD